MSLNIDRGKSCDDFVACSQPQKSKGKTMGAILELTTYAATPVGMVAIVAIGAAAYFAARWVLVD